MKVSFFTLGCKVNQYETEALKEDFSKRGYHVINDEMSVGSKESADIYVINTCTVTNLADRKSRQFIRRAKTQNPDAVIAVTGCYAQIDPEAVSKIPGVNLIAGTNEKQNLVDYIEDYIRQNEDLAEVHVLPYEELCGYESHGIITAMESRTRAYIKIQEGCNRFCSYCIIPMARGRVRSRDEDEILEEVKGLIKAGFKEIVLTGINTALYGQEKGLGLAGLLKKIDQIPGDFRVRLSSLEPTVVSLEEVESILDSKRLCHHLHLSIQSGSDGILSAMKRNYGRKEYLEIVKLLRSKDPFYGITTDIIVGFPGETNEDFLDSMKIVEEVGFNKVHEFRYSPRAGTKAAELPNQISGLVKKQRGEALSKKADEVSKEFFREIVESSACLKVLLEEIVEVHGKKYAVGYSDNYIRVFMDAEQGAQLINEFVEVKPIDVYNGGIRGEIRRG